MKKLYLTLCLALSGAFLLNAQSYIPLLDSVNIWQYNSNLTPVQPPSKNPTTQSANPCSYFNWFNIYMTQNTTTDTIIDSLTYKIVKQIDDINPVYCDFGYVREDTSTRHVWFKDNLGNPEYLLYDFSLQTGDTISLFFNTNGVYSPGVYTVDSILPFQIRTGMSRMFYLKNHSSPFSPTLYWVEGVGCLMNVFYPYCVNANVGAPLFPCNYYPTESFEYMTCFDHQTKIYFDSCKYNSALTNFCFMLTDSCNYYNICGKIEENTLAIEMDIFPTPATDDVIFRINAPNNMNLNIIITDAFGRVVKVADRTSVIGNVSTVIEQDITELSPGYYYVILSSEGKTYSKAFVIQ